MERTRFYRNTITIIVLTDDEPVSSEMSLADIEREFTEGSWSAGPIQIQSEEVNPITMASLLQEQGSSPDFFGLGDIDLPEENA